MKKSKHDKKENNRLKEVIAILMRHDILKGLTPQRLRGILEELGPTFIKFGQIVSMRSDMFPIEFCNELRKLHSDVKPMPFDEVIEVIESSLGYHISNLFGSLEQEPLGSASIAQVHKATLLSGECIVVKVQRKGVKEVMSRDIKLLRRAAKILKVTRGMNDILDFDLILDELWRTTQEELDFLMEASRLETFYQNNEEVRYASCPKVFKHLTSSKVLTMEFIDGIFIDDVDELKNCGYDLKEIGTKLAENYSKQVMEDGLFHADPHPGNIIVRQGEIVWVDLGMMGTLSNHGRTLLLKFTSAVSQQDVSGIKEVVLSIGSAQSTIDHSLLYSDIDDILKAYGTMDFGGLDIAKYLNEVLEVAMKHGIKMPSSYAMLARGLTNLEGVLELVSPEINYMEIASAHLAEDYIKNFNMIHSIQMVLSNIGGAIDKISDMPNLLSQFMIMLIKGQTKIGMELQNSEGFEIFVTRLVNDIVMGLIISALLIGSSLIATTDMKPQVLDIPLLGAMGYSIAAILSIWVIIDLRKARKK